MKLVSSTQDGRNLYYSTKRKTFAYTEHCIYEAIKLFFLVLVFMKNL